MIILVTGILAGPVQAQSGEPPPQLTVHVVEQGETLFSIAQHYGVTVDAITHANAVSDPRKIYVGQRLIIPRGPASIGPTETAPYILEAGDTLASIAQRYGTTWHALAQLNDLMAPNVVVASAPAAWPQRTASGSDLPSARATASPPTNASPAAVVSTGSTSKAGNRCIPSF